MSYIITDDKHYKDIANSIRSKMQTDREYYPDDMAIAVDNIPSSADGTDNPITGYNFNVVEIDGKDCLLLHDQDIRYVIEDYEEVSDPVPSTLIHPNTDIIV